MQFVKQFGLEEFLQILHKNKKSPKTIYCDNMFAIVMIKNRAFHAKTKHVELCHHFIRSLVNNQEIRLNFVNTNEQ